MNDFIPDRVHYQFDRGMKLELNHDIAAMSFRGFQGHPDALRTNGQVLIAGGGAHLASAELYDPSRGTRAKSGVYTQNLSMSEMAIYRQLASTMGL